MIAGRLCQPSDVLQKRPATKLFKSIENAIPTLAMAIARFPAGQLLVGQSQFRSAAVVE
jgi:hypothetical protein